MRTKEELNALKEVETLNKKLTELTEEELEQVDGGIKPVRRQDDCNMLELGFCYKDNALLIPLVRKPDKKICMCSKCGSIYGRKKFGNWMEE